MSFDDGDHAWFSPPLTLVPELVQPPSFMTIPACSESWEMSSGAFRCCQVPFYFSADERSAAYLLGFSHF